MTRRLLSAALLALLVVLGVGLAAAPASADLPGVTDCKQEPVPERPGTGLAGWLSSTPNPLPVEGDPFAPNPTTSVFEQYGYAGLHWDTYDLGCGPDAAQHPDAIIGTTFANWLFELPKGAVALTNSVTDVAFHPTFLDALDPLLLKVTDVLRGAVFDQWYAVVLAALGFYLIAKVRRQSLASATAALLFAVAVMVGTVVLFTYPVKAGHVADESIGQVIGTVASGLSGQQATSSGDPAAKNGANVHSAVLYQQWLIGTFGKASGPTVDKYGPIIFRSTAFTYAEQARAEANPEVGKALVEQKQEAYKQAAAEIADTDPDTYEYLTGKRSYDRVSAAFISAFASGAALPFLLFAAGLVIGSYLVIRLAVMTSPLLGTLALYPSMHSVARGALETVGAAFINSIVFGIGSGITVLGIGTLLSPDTALPRWLGVVLVLLFTVVMWTVLRPFRRLTAMVRGGNPLGDAAGAIGERTRSTINTATRLATNAASSGFGSYLGTRNALEDHDEDVEEAAAARAEEVARTEPTAVAVPVTQAVLPAGTAGPAALPAGHWQRADVPAREAERTADGALVMHPPRASEPREPLALDAAPEPVTVEPDVAVYSPGATAAEAAEAATDNLLPPVEPEVLDGQEVYVLYRPDGAEVTPAAESTGSDVRA